VTFFSSLNLLFLSGSAHDSAVNAVIKAYRFLPRAQCTRLPVFFQLIAANFVASGKKTGQKHVRPPPAGLKQELRGAAWSARGSAGFALQEKGRPLAFFSAKRGKNLCGPLKQGAVRGYNLDKSNGRPGKRRLRHGAAAAPRRGPASNIGRKNYAS
jgi:hypothetical protein